MYGSEDGGEASALSGVEAVLRCDGGGGEGAAVAVAVAGLQGQVEVVVVLRPRQLINVHRVHVLWRTFYKGTVSRLVGFMLSRRRAAYSF